MLHTYNVNAGQERNPGLRNGKRRWDYALPTSMVCVFLVRVFRLVLLQAEPTVCFVKALPSHHLSGAKAGQGNEGP